MIIRTKPKNYKPSFQELSHLGRFRFWETRELIRCFLWVNKTNCSILYVLFHKDYYTCIQVND